MRAAVHRTTPSGHILNGDERVTARTALTLFLGRAAEPTRPRTVEPGQPGDLCILSVPPHTALAELDAEVVDATIVSGEVVHCAR
jgi:predicted amidohydrolase YtcJ